MSAESQSSVSGTELGTLLDRFEIAATKRSSARRAFHAGERWVDDGKASHPTESYLIDSDNEARAARLALEQYVGKLQKQLQEREG